jgi:hypothetical protein
MIAHSNHDFNRIFTSTARMEQALPAIVAELLTMIRVYFINIWYDLWKHTAHNRIVQTNHVAGNNSGVACY